MSSVLDADEVTQERLEVILDTLRPRGRVIDLATFEPELLTSEAALQRRTPTSTGA